MSRLNTLPKVAMTTNEVATPVRAISAEQQLVRMTLAHLMYEDQFYLDGQDASKTITGLVQRVNSNFTARLAHLARTRFKLRHVPLLLTRELARKRELKAADLANVIERPDEMAEFLSIYWKDGKTAISNQVKKGLAMAFSKFNEYQLAKWDKNSAAIKLRDVMFLVHPKPANANQAELFRKVADGQLTTPDTWETQLSAGADKRETFERLMAEKKLGALAFLRNLRNMVQAGIDSSVIRAYGTSVDASKVLPFRYIAAARIVPQFEDMLEQMMFESLASMPKIKGKTKLYIDVSGSMFGAKVSAKSDLDRFDAAAALAVMCRELCEEVEIYSFSNSAVQVAPRRGFALVEAIRNSQGHGGTMLGNSLKQTQSKSDRIIVFTDEQSYDRPAAPFAGAKGYIIDVASYKNGINHSAWTAISGFSEAVLDYIQAFESADELIR